MPCILVYTDLPVLRDIYAHVVGQNGKGKRVSAHAAVSLKRLFFIFFFHRPGRGVSLMPLTFT